MVADPYKRYRQVQVDTTNPVRLVVMLYEAAIGALRQAIAAIERRDYERKGKELLRAHDILFELLSCLDHEKGGQVAANLASLYTYMLKRILEANRSLEIPVLEEVIGHLTTLNEGWRQLAEQPRPAVEAAAQRAATELLLGKTAAGER